MSENNVTQKLEEYVAKVKQRCEQNSSLLALSTHTANALKTTKLSEEIAILENVQAILDSIHKELEEILTTTQPQEDTE